MLACGESQSVIARAIGCDPDTLRKHFADELANGLAKRRREVVELLFKNARKGNVSAQKKLEDMTRVAGAAAAFTGATDGADKTAKQPKLGKKEQAAQEATNAGTGTEWGDDLQVPPARLN